MGYERFALVLLRRAMRVYIVDMWEVCSEPMFNEGSADVLRNGSADWLTRPLSK